jgi:hypothetical protein
LSLRFLEPNVTFKCLPNGYKILLAFRGVQLGNNPCMRLVERKDSFSIRPLAIISDPKRLYRVPALP